MRQRIMVFRRRTSIRFSDVDPQLRPTRWRDRLEWGEYFRILTYGFHAFPRFQ